MKRTKVGAAGAAVGAAMLSGCGPAPYGSALLRVDAYAGRPHINTVMRTEGERALSALEVVAVTHAAQRWNDALRRQVFRVSRNEALAGTTTLEYVDNRPTDRIAATFWRYADVTENSRVEFYAHMRDAQYAARFESTALHELGHVLGLMHVEDEACVMKPRAAEPRGEPCQAEVDAVSAMFERFDKELK